MANSSGSVLSLSWKFGRYPPCLKIKDGNTPVSCKLAGVRTLYTSNNSNCNLLKQLVEQHQSQKHSSAIELLTNKPPPIQTATAQFILYTARHKPDICSTTIVQVPSGVVLFPISCQRKDHCCSMFITAQLARSMQFLFYVLLPDSFLFFVCLL